MKISFSMVRYALLGATLAATPLWMQAQDNSKDNRKVERRSERKAPRDQRKATPENAQPAQGERPRPAGEAQPRVQQSQPRVQQSEPRRENPAPQVHQAQPPWSNQPGRTFGNPPGRPMDVPHGQTQMGTRPMVSPNGTVTYHPSNRPRRVEVVRPGGRVVVASSPGHGYVQREMVVRNTTIIKRTYIYNGVPHARIYRPYSYGGISLAVYTPVRYYRPAFYSYVYNPWPRPIVYGWGWNGRPWYAYYGGYFRPYPAYASPALWLTDFFIAATLEAAYDERMSAAQNASAYGYPDDGQGAPMSPEVKQAIAEEVRRQIESERAGEQAGYGGGPVGGIFADNGSHVFVAYDALTVNSNAGECSLREGDVLQTNGAPPEGSASAAAIVLSSRGMDCPRGSTVWVGIADLQEMQNQMRATVDRGMNEMQSRQGQGGLPQLPPGSAGAIDSPLAAQAQPDANVSGELASVYQEGGQAEQQAVSAYQPGTPTLSLGLTIDQVKAIQGEPETIVDLGSRQIYLYKDLKITFTDGKVTDIQ
jgi:hypothetical protein